MPTKLIVMAIAAAAAVWLVITLVVAWPVLMAHSSLSMVLLAIQIVLTFTLLLALYRKIRKSQPIREFEVIFIAFLFLSTWSQAIMILARIGGVR